MKKLLVLALAVVLTLSLTVVASAATFDPYVGGEFQLIWSEDVNGDGTPLSSEYSTYPPEGSHARYKSYVTGTVKDEETNTWAKVGVLFKCWNEDHASKGDNHQGIYEAGIKGIGDVLDIWYTNDENPNTKRGMVPLKQDGMKFGGDPGFSDGQPGLGFDYNSDSVTINVLYDPNEGPEALSVVAGTFKFDGGNVWAGIRNNKDESTQMGVGMSYGLGIGTLSVDYIQSEPDGGDAVSYLQANMNFTDLGLDVTIVSDDQYQMANEGGIGVGVTYNINDKFYVGLKSLTADNDEEFSEYYFGIKHGVLETRLGSFDNGVDSFSYITVHAGLW